MFRGEELLKANKKTNIRDTWAKDRLENSQDSNSQYTREKRNVSKPAASYTFFHWLPDRHTALVFLLPFQLFLMSLPFKNKLFIKV